MKQEESSPLTRQVGGDHYKKYIIQPIELTAMAGLNGLQSEVMGYVLRYKDKNGLQDLEKAYHTAEIANTLHRESYKVTQQQNACFQTFIRVNGLEEMAGLLNGIMYGYWWAVMFDIDKLMEEYKPKEKK